MDYVTSYAPASRVLTQSEFADLCRGAEVLEQDAHGLKVLRLADGDILKLFRVKRRWSSAQLVPYSRRFCRNAARLARLDVPTVQVKAEFRLAAAGLSAVLYHPLPGRTLRQVGMAGGLDSTLMQALGMFIAKLHRQGIFFRSLHLGNIVLTPDAGLGLIDIADMRIRPWSLFCGQRLRNFRHLCRLEEDRRMLGVSGWREICGAYVATAQLSNGCERRFVWRSPRIFCSD